MRRKICFRASNFEITKREVMFSVIIALVMVVVGLFINGAISDGIAESNERYYKALKITDADQFQYGLQTSIGNALVYGSVNAVKPVSMPEVNGEWFYIECVKERYTKKTRTVTETDSKGNSTTKTEVYYEWDRVNSEKLNADRFLFMGRDFENNLYGIPTSRIELSEFAKEKDKVHWNYLYEDNYFFESVGDVRYYFYAIPKEFNATLEVKLKQNEIASWQDTKNITTHYESTIPQVMDGIESKEQVVGVIFWVVWCALICAAVVGFCYLDNWWIEDKEW